MSEYKIQVDDFSFDIDPTDFDGIEVGKNTFHLLKDQKSYEAKVLAIDWSAKTLTIEINNSPYQVKISDQYDQLVKKMGFEVSDKQQANDIKAPMPGLVLEVSVEEGQEVKEGDGLVILEAMKMENIIKSAGSGIVKTILIKKGTAVDKGQLLIEMEAE